MNFNTINKIIIYKLLYSFKKIFLKILFFVTKKNYRIVTSKLKE